MTTHDRRARNYQAFNAILEHYESTKYHSSAIPAVDESRAASGTPNPAKPSPLDFVCDVESTIMSVIDDREWYDKFMDTYLLGKDLLSKSRKNYYEQRIGKLFCSRSIFPVSKYYQTVRTKREN